MRFLFAFVVALTLVPEASFSNTSAKDKAEKQKKLLQLGAIVSAGAGIYLLAKKCNPSSTPKPPCPDSGTPAAADAKEPTKSMAVVDKILSGVPATLAFSQSFLCSSVLSALTAAPVALAKDRVTPIRPQYIQRIKDPSSASVLRKPVIPTQRQMMRGVDTVKKTTIKIRAAKAQGADTAREGGFAPERPIPKTDIGDEMMKNQQHHQRVKAAKAQGADIIREGGFAPEAQKTSYVPVENPKSPVDYMDPAYSDFAPGSVPRPSGNAAQRPSNSYGTSGRGIAIESGPERYGSPEYMKRMREIKEINKIKLDEAIRRQNTEVQQYRRSKYHNTADAPSDDGSGSAIGEEFGDEYAEQIEATGETSASRGELGPIEDLESPVGVEQETSSVSGDGTATATGDGTATGEAPRAGAGDAAMTEGRTDAGSGSSTEVSDETAEAAANKAKSKPCTNGPPKTTIGCVLGPVALGAAVMMYMKSREMGEIEDQFSGGAMANGGSGGGEGSSGSGSEPPFPLNARGEPEDMAVPCPDNPQETCILTDGGSKIVSPDGSYVETAQVATSIPDTPETQQAMQEATNSQQVVIAKAQAIDPDFKSPLGTSSSGQGIQIASLPPPGSGGGGTGGTTPGAISSFAGGGVGYGGYGGGGGENALYSQFAGGVAGESGGGGTRDNDRGYGQFAGSSGADSFAEQEKKASGLRGFFGSFGGRSPASSSAAPEEHSIPFGNTRVGAAHTNIFSLAQDRYLTLRDRGEFYEGPMTPMSGGRQ